MTPADTRAIVICVERYPNPTWDVFSPVPDACRFVSWLLHRGVPAANITVLAAPTDKNRGELDRLLPGQYRQATTTAVKNAFLALEGAPRGSLIVYWAGHGYQDGVGGQHLLVPTDRGTGHLAVNRLLAWLASERVPLADQLLIIDACRQHGDSFGVTAEPVEFPAALRAAIRNQQLIQSAAVGEKAAVIAAERTGVFSKFLLQELQALPAQDWLPDASALAEKLSAHNDPRLAPVTVTSSDAKGNQTTMTLGRPNATTHDDDHADHIIKLLMAIHELDTPKNRRKLHQSLRWKFKGQFPMLPVTPSIKEIVDVLDRMTPGWHRLREVVEDHKYDLFIPDMKAVRDLTDYLDSILDSDE